MARRVPVRLVIPAAETVVLTYVDLDSFTPSLGCLLDPSVNRLATQLSAVHALEASERIALLEQTRASILDLLHAKLSRLLLLELHAARLDGRLTRSNSKERWNEFLGLSASRTYWQELEAHYPNLLKRVDAMVRNRCDAAFVFAQRWAADRSSLNALCGPDPGLLQDIHFGAGDSHRGGQTVAVLTCEARQIVYKPRCVKIDAELGQFIAQLQDDHDATLSFRVPSVVVGDGYGWSQFIEHRYAADDEELQSFYCGIGQLLATMHLFSASDLHSENIIAHGGTPVVIDCETLFTPKPVMPASGLGDALDRASGLVAGTVLNIGLLPGRGEGLAWRGVDNSGIGALAGEQPMFAQPAIINAGTDEAYLGSTMVPLPLSQNHPSAEPALARYWPDALDAFASLTDTLQRLDKKSDLAWRLRRFDGSRVRVVLRPTESYAELARMLWHPVSLHREAEARDRAVGLLAKMASNAPSAPSDLAVIAAEVDDLMVGDVPFFDTDVEIGRLDGPNGTSWLPARNLAEDAIVRWRASDRTLDCNIIRAAMVSAYLNDGWKHFTSLKPDVIRTDDLDRRRKEQAARLMRGLVSNAIIGNDNTVAWIAPVLNQTGWSVQPLGVDLYAGLSGIAVLAGAYVHEVRAGRATPVDGVDDIFSATRNALQLAEIKIAQTRSNGMNHRPPPLGAYIGLGSQIWTLLTLSRFTNNADNELERAVALSKGMRAASETDEMGDLLTGRAGAIAPLLSLFATTHNEEILDIAKDLGDAIRARAIVRDGKAFWAHEQMWPQGLGGFSHGVTGVGWALLKLARVTNELRFAELAEAAFAFEDSLFDPEENNWIDMRALRGTKSVGAWCHGSVGIGLAHLDLDPNLRHPRTGPIIKRSVPATLELGLGWNHCLCHGDLGAWELLSKAIDHKMAPSALTQESLLGGILSSLEQFGPTCGLTREVFAPGLLPGVGGVAYQLLRAHPQARLPSVLTLESS